MAQMYTSVDWDKGSINTLELCAKAHISQYAFTHDNDCLKLKATITQIYSTVADVPVFLLLLSCFFKRRTKAL